MNKRGGKIFELTQERETAKRESPFCDRKEKKDEGQ